MLSLIIYERMYRSDKMPGAEFVLAMRARARRKVRVTARDLRVAHERLKERTGKLRKGRR